MALWLCRLDAEEWPEAKQARRLGISAWVFRLRGDFDEPKQVLHTRSPVASVAAGCTPPTESVGATTARCLQHPRIPFG